MLKFIRLAIRDWRTFRTWDMWIPVIVAGVVAGLPRTELLEERFTSILIAESTVMIAVIGATIAALSLTFSPMSADLIQRIIDRVPGGLAQAMLPFFSTAFFAMVTALVGIFTLSLCEVCSSGINFLPRFMLGVSTFFFTLTLVSVVQIVGVIRVYLEIRAEHDGERSEEASSTSDPPRSI